MFHSFHSFHWCFLVLQGPWARLKALANFCFLHLLATWWSHPTKVEQAVRLLCNVWHNTNCAARFSRAHQRHFSWDTQVTSNRNSCMNSVSLPCQPSSNTIIACDTLQLPKFLESRDVRRSCPLPKRMRRIDAWSVNSRTCGHWQADKGERQGLRLILHQSPWNAATIWKLYSRYAPAYDVWLSFDELAGWMAQWTQTAAENQPPRGWANSWNFCVWNIRIGSGLEALTMTFCTFCVNSNCQWLLISEAIAGFGMVSGHPDHYQNRQTAEFQSRSSKRNTSGSWRCSNRSSNFW